MTKQWISPMDVYDKIMQLAKKHNYSIIDLYDGSCCHTHYIPVSAIVSMIENGELQFKED